MKLQIKILLLLVVALFVLLYTFKKLPCANFLIYFKSNHVIFLSYNIYFKIGNCVPLFFGVALIFKCLKYFVAHIYCI
jgi:hypothetical protein